MYRRGRRHKFPGGGSSSGSFARIAVSERRAVATRSRLNLRDDPIATAPGSDTNSRLALRQTCSLTTTPRFLVSVNGKPIRGYNQGRSNKSFGRERRERVL